MGETKDELTEYFDVPDVERVNYCVVRLSEYEGVNMKKLLAEHPELNDNYIYLKDSNSLIDRKRAEAISDPAMLGVFSPDDIMKMAESGILKNPNINFNMRLIDDPENPENKADVEKFRDVIKALGDRKDALRLVHLSGRGFGGLMTPIENWKDEDIKELLQRVKALSIHMSRPLELLPRVKDIIYSNPELNESFLISGNYMCNVRKTYGLREKEGIGFDANPKESKELRLEKIFQFMKNNPGSVVEERISGISELPEEFLEKIDDPTKLRFVLPLGKENEKFEYIYTAQDLQIIKSHLNELEEGLKKGWNNTELAAFLSELESIDLKFIEDEDTKKRILELLENVPELKNKFIYMEGAEKALNCESYKMTGAETFGKSRSKGDTAYYHKVVALLKNNPGKFGRITIEGIKDLSPEDLELLAQNDENVNISIPKGPYEFNSDTYNASELLVIRKKLDELLVGIDPNAPELKKFGEIYRRVCTAFVYDYPAAYPKTPEEEEYAKNNSANCRNLRNALLEGKCVCAGYADVLRQALDMYGIEAEYVLGDCIDAPISKEKYEKHKDEEGYKFKSVLKDEDGKVTLGEKHAWVKVKIDGIWYNCDPTFDASQYARGELPEYALIPDSKISRNGTARINITGPECTEISPFDKVPDYVKAPTKKEMKAAKKEQEEKLKKEQLGEDKQHGFSAMMNRIMDKIKNAFSRKNQKLLDSGQTEKIVNDENEAKVAASPKEEKYPSWDLRGYKDAKPIIVPPQIHTNDRKINDKEKDNDGR